MECWNSNIQGVDYVHAQAMCTRPIFRRGSEATSRHAFIITRTCEFAVLLESNMLLCEDNCVSISFSINASQSCCLSLLDHFVVIKRHGIPVDLPDMLFIIIRT